MELRQCLNKTWERRQREPRLCSSIKHTVTNADNFFPYHCQNRRLKLIVICHLLFVKQLLLNSPYTLSSAVRRSCFFSWPAKCISVWTQLDAKVTPSKVFSLSSEYNGRKGILQSILTILLYFLNGRCLDIKFPLMGRVWEWMSYSVCWAPPSFPSCFTMGSAVAAYDR